MKKIYIFYFLILFFASFVYASFNVNLINPQNNTYLNYNSVDFTFTSIGNYSQYNCSIYTNRTGTWMINQTNESVSNNTITGFSLFNFLDGNYYWNVYCENNSENNWSISNYTLTVDTIYPNWSNNLTNPLSGVIYDSSQNYQFNVSFSDDNLNEVWTEHNFTGLLQNFSITGNVSGEVFYYDYLTLATGSYKWRMYANDSAGNVNFTEYFFYEVNKANSTINLTINGTSTNSSINQTWSLNITGNLILGEGNIELYINGLLANNGSSVVTNITTFDYAGNYNITLVYSETENYSYSSVTYWIEVNDTCIWPQNGDWVIGGNERIICVDKSITPNNINFSGDSITIINSSIDSNINLIGSSELTIISSNYTGPGSVLLNAYDNASIFINNSILRYVYFLLNNNNSIIISNCVSPYSGSLYLFNYSNATFTNNTYDSGSILLYDNSEINILTSSIKDVNQYNNSTLNFMNSTLDNWWLSISNIDNITISNMDINVSMYGTLESEYMNLSSNFINSSYSQNLISSDKSSNITVLNSTIYYFETGHGANKIIDTTIINTLIIEENSTNYIENTVINFSDTNETTSIRGRSSFFNFSIIDKLSFNNPTLTFIEINFSNTTVEKVSDTGNGPGIIFFRGNVTFLDKIFSNFVSGTNITRIYPSEIKYTDGSLFTNQANIIISRSGTEVFSANISSGYLDINLTFNSTNYNDTLTITVNNVSAGTISMLNDTPLNVVYDNCDWSTNGDWIINGSDKIVCAGKNIVLNGSLSVETNANFKLLNSNLTINRTNLNQTYSIIFKENSSNRIINSKITDVQLSFYTYFQDNSYNIINNSEIISTISFQDTSNSTIDSSILSRSLIFENNSYTKIKNSSYSSISIYFTNKTSTINNFNSNTHNYIFSSTDGLFIVDLENLTSHQWVTLKLYNNSNFYVHNSTLLFLYFEMLEGQNNLIFNKSNLTRLSGYYNSRIFLYDSFVNYTKISHNSSLNCYGSPSIIQTSLSIGSTNNISNTVINGNLTLSSSMVTFYENSTVIRNYPTYIYYQNNTLVDNVLINITNLNQSIFSGTTSNGYLEINLTFNYTNYQETYNITIGNYTRGNISLLTDTPLNIIYDVSAPEITFNYPQNNSFVNSTSFQLNITTDDLSTCIYKLNNNSYIDLSTVFNTSHIKSISNFNNQVYSLTVNCTNQFDLNSVESINFTIDTIIPLVDITYPNESQLINSLNLNLNYSLNDTYLDSAWYLIDFNSTKNYLNISQNNSSFSFIYPGKHFIRIYVNDSAGNINSLLRTFYVNSSINITKWENELILENSEIQSIEIFNSINIITGLNNIMQNLSLEINLTNISIKIINISANLGIWSYKFNISEQDPNYKNDINLIIGTNPVDYIIINNFSNFYNYENTYFGIIKLPNNRSYYTNLYYCENENISKCTTIASSCNTFSSSQSNPCYNSTRDNTNIYVPHFSSVFGDIDTVPPNITIISPQNNTLFDNGYNKNLSFTTNENSKCGFTLNSNPSVSYTFNENTSFYYLFNNQDAVWNNGNYLFNITCNDSYNNQNNELIYFSVSDNTDPRIIQSYVDEDSNDAELYIRTDEPTVCKYHTEDISYSEMNNSYFPNSDRRLEHVLTVETSGTYYILCRDIMNNQVSKSLSVSIGGSDNSDDSSSTDSGSDGPPSSGPKKLVVIWEKLDVGEHSMDISSDEIPITQIKFNLLKEKNKTVSILVEKREKLPKGYPNLNYIVYDYFRISANNLNEEDLEKIIFKIKVKIDWFTSNNTDRNTVKLYRFTDKWNELKTELVDTDSNYFYYDATSPGFSYFGINAIEKTQSPTDNSTIIDQLTNETQDKEIAPVTGQVTQNETKKKEDKFEFVKQIIKKPFNFIWPVFVMLVMSIFVVFLIYQNKYSVVTDKDLKELRNYIQNCEAEGVAFKKIKETLINVGWKETLIDLVLHDVHLPSESMDKLVKYIEFATQNKMSKSQIKENLQKVGWQAEVIENAFSKTE